MSDFDIAQKRASMETDIATYHWCIHRNYREISDLEDKIERLQQRLIALAEFERVVNRQSMDDLLRLCHTPCWRYR